MPRREGFASRMNIGNWGVGADASLLQPRALAPDASGNLWVSNSGQSDVVMFFGVAPPTVTPVGTSPTAP